MALPSESPDPIESFFARLADAPRRALLLDYDGTLAPFRVEHRQALPYPGVRELLADLRADGATRVAFVSGRGVADVVRLLSLEGPLEVWGCHGAEHLLPDGSYRLRPLEERCARGLREAEGALRRLAPPDACETKPAGIALHLRGLPAAQAERVRASVEAAWAGIAGRDGLAVVAFDGGVELRVPGIHKGEVVEQVLDEMGPEAAVAYLGDDLTDEDAFRALSGRGLGVLVRGQWRPTAAAARITPPEQLLEFLARWRRATGGGTDGHAGRSP